MSRIASYIGRAGALLFPLALLTAATATASARGGKPHGAPTRTSSAHASPHHAGAASSARAHDAAARPGEARATEAKADPARKPRTITVNNAVLHYIDVGSGEAVVFIHGSPGDYRTWSKQIDAFAPSFRVIAYSLRNCFPNRVERGLSANDSLGTHVRDLAALLKALRINHAHLVGESYGAAVALMTAIRHPHIVRSLVLAAPLMVPPARDDRKADSLAASFVRSAIVPARKAFRANNLKQGVRSVVDGYLGDDHGFDKLPGQVRSVMMQNAEKVKLESATRNPIPVIRCADAEKVDIPVLLIQGERGPYWLTRVSQPITSALPRMEQARLSGPSFGASLRFPGEFNRVTLSFVARH